MLKIYVMNEREEILSNVTLESNDCEFLILQSTNDDGVIDKKIIDFKKQQIFEFEITTSNKQIDDVSSKTAQASKEIIDILKKANIEVSNELQNNINVSISSYLKIIERNTKLGLPEQVREKWGI